MSSFHPSFCEKKITVEGLHKSESTAPPARVHPVIYVVGVFFQLVFFFEKGGGIGEKIVK